MKAVVVERWEIPLPERTEGDKWFLDWVIAQPNMLGRHLAASWIAFESINTKVKSALEVFGGIGGQSLIISDVFKPKLHAAMEVSEEAYRHLERNKKLLGLNTVWHADAYKDGVPWKHPSDERDGWDFVSMDFGDFTVRWLEDGHRRDLIDSVLDRNPEAFTITDIAGPYLHLQRGVYERILGGGAGDSHASYLEALIGRIESVFGYQFTGGGYHRGSAVLGFQRGAPYVSVKDGLERVTQPFLRVEE